MKTIQSASSYSLLLSFLLVMFFGCSQKITTDALNARLSMQNTKMTTALEELIQWRNTINIQGRALTDAERFFVRDVDALETDFIGWQALEEPAGKKDLQRRVDALDALVIRAERLLERDLPGKE